MNAARSEPVTLGNKYTDPITRVTGVATARFEYLYGCVRICLEYGQGGDAKELIVDEQRLTDVPAATSGGARPAPAAREGGRR